MIARSQCWITLGTSWATFWLKLNKSGPCCKWKCGQNMGVIKRFSGPRKLLHLWLRNRQTEGLSQRDKASTVPPSRGGLGGDAPPLCFVCLAYKKATWRAGGKNTEHAGGPRRLVFFFCFFFEDMPLLPDAVDKNGPDTVWLLSVGARLCPGRADLHNVRGLRWPQGRKKTNLY